MEKIYIAIVQRPMASLDETRVEVFRNIVEAQTWVDKQLADPEECEGYSEDEMNWDIIERIIA